VTGSPIPDAITPTTGWRMWREVQHGRLTSVTRDDIWTPGEAMHATCGNLLSARRHHVYRGAGPYEDCTCGLYAKASLLDLLQAYDPEVAAGQTEAMAIGTVKLWGEVVEGTTGYRATMGYPDTIYVLVPEHVPSPAFITHGEAARRAYANAIATRLAASYRCTVRVAWTVEEVAEAAGCDEETRNWARMQPEARSKVRASMGMFSVPAASVMLQNLARSLGGQASPASTVTSAQRRASISFAFGGQQVQATFLSPRPRRSYAWPLRMATMGLALIAIDLLAWWAGDGFDGLPVVLAASVAAWALLDAYEIWRERRGG
jgi:hypothetical protein